MKNMNLEQLRQKNTTVAISRFPNEVFGILFHECSKVGRFQAIRAVCHSWRDVAHNTASLWRNISYVEGYDLGITPMDEVEAYLRHSKSLSIDIAMTVDYEAMHYGRFLEKIRPHLHRCRSFDAFTDTPEQTYDIFPLKGPLPMLRVIKQRYDESGDQGDEEFCLVQDNSPCQLRTLQIELSNATFQGIDPLTLQHLYVCDFVDANALHKFVSKCQNLRSFEIMTLTTSTAYDWATPARLEHLESLTIHADLSWLSFDAPQLKHLKCTMKDDGSLDASRSPGLRSLSMHWGAISLSHILSFIRAHRELVALKVPVSGHTAALLLDLFPERTGAGPNNESEASKIRLIRLLSHRDTNATLISETLRTIRAVLHRESSLIVEWDYHGGSDAELLKALETEKRLQRVNDSTPKLEESASLL